MGILETLGSLSKFARMGNWIYYLQIGLGFELLFLLFSGNPLEHSKKLPLFIFYHACLLAYTFAINSVSDQKPDSEAGKDFGLKDFPKWFISISIAFFASMSVLIPAFLGFKSAVLGALIFALVSGYSLSPIRLKEKGIAGLVSLGLSLVSLPFLLFVLVVGENYALGFFLAFLLFMKQLLDEAPHQIEDFENDKKTGIRTFAVVSGKEALKKFIKLVLLIYLISLFFSFGFGIEAGLLIFVAVFAMSLPVIGSVRNILSK